MAVLKLCDTRKFKVLSSGRCINFSKDEFDFILSKVRYDRNKAVGRGIENGKFNTVLFGQDNVIGCFGFGDGLKVEVPECLVSLVKYIKSLYESDFPVSSFSICENRRGGVDVDLTNSDSNEVYTYKFAVNGGKVVYDDYYPDAYNYCRWDEQYFPSIDSDEPDVKTFCNLVYDVLVYCISFEVPIKRVCIFSEDGSISLEEKACRYGISSNTKYYGVGKYLYEGIDNTIFFVDDEEYDLCIILSKEN